MTTKRIIPCLDLKNGRIVKGRQFLNLRDAGDPVELAEFYAHNGADELVMLDITASQERRTTILDVVQRVATAVKLPLIIGGGISELAHMQQILAAGADKVSLGTAAVQRPELLNNGAAEFGRQCLVLAVDAKWSASLQTWEVYTHGGRQATGKAVLDWVVEAAQRGAGEILLTSIDADGAKAGYDLPLTAAVAQAVNIPVIASGGAGTKEDFYTVLTEGRAAAALAASVFHYRQVTIVEVKEYLAARGVAVDDARRTEV